MYVQYKDTTIQRNIILLVLLFVPNLIQLAQAQTVYKTRIHTKVNLSTVYRTSLSTIWKTTNFDENITLAPTVSTDSEGTSTLTITKTTYTTLGQFESEILVAHNAKRQLHVDTGDLLWSNEIAQSAQEYADQYNCNGTLIHSHNEYGENLALGYNTTAALEAWYDEIKLYDYNDAKFDESTGHFTQVVWKNSSLLGCGWKYCDEYYGQYTVCQYKDPGNYANQFEQNVLPLRASS